MIQTAPAALIFDLDDTLIPSSQFYAPAVAHALNHDQKLVDMYAVARKMVKADLPPLHTSARNRLLYFKRLLELIDDHQTSAVRLCDHYEKKLCQLITDWARTENRLGLIRKLQSRYPTFILTNETARTQLLKIDALCQGQSHGFCGIVCSEEIGFEKPDHRIFQNLFKRYSLNPVRCLFIGDSAENDILGARDHNLPTIQTVEFVSDDGQTGDTRKIQHLCELLDILP